jgi:hypothetical protein
MPEFCRKGKPVKINLKYFKNKLTLSPFPEKYQLN